MTIQQLHDLVTANETQNGSSDRITGARIREVDNAIIDKLAESAGSISEPFLAVTGTEMNYSNSAKFKKSISENTELTLTNTSDGKAGLIYITSTGVNTLKINGINIPLNTATTKTVIGFVNVGADVIEYFTNVGGTSGGSSAWIDVVYGTGNLTAIGKVWQGIDTGYGNYGSLPTVIPANTAVRHIAQYNSTDNLNAIISFNKTLVIVSYPHMDFGLCIPGDVHYFGYAHLGATHLLTIPPFNINEWYGILRQVDGTIILQRSMDKITWNNVFTLPEIYTGVLYIYANTYASSKLDTPQYNLL